MKNFNDSYIQSLSKKRLPHNFLAEKIILSSVLLNSEALEIVLRNVKIDTFYFKNHQELYKIIIRMYKSKIPVDIVTLNTYLQNYGLLENIGGIDVLTELINHIPNLTYLEEYIYSISDKFIRRSLIKLGYEIINSAYITNISSELILHNLEQNIFNLKNEIEIHKTFNNTELIASIFLELKQKSLNPSLSGLTSGFYNLDSFTQGFQKSDLIILASRPSMGKTALSLNIALNVIKNFNLPVLFFSLEMSREQLIYRLIASESKINYLRLKTGNFYEDDWSQITKVLTQLSSLPLFIDDTPNISMQNIRLTIKKILFEQNQIGLVIFDYLQLMQTMTPKFKNRVQELSELTRFLKNLAREFQVPIIVLSQLSRNVENRTNKRPILSDLRESGSIEQDADLVLMLYRANYYNSVVMNKNEKNIVELIIAKQRNGPIGMTKLKFNSEYGEFSNDV